MTIQTRREFLGKLGWMFAGGILVPYVPKTFYSIPGPVVSPDIKTIDFKINNNSIVGKHATISIRTSDGWQKIIGTGSWKIESQGIKEFMIQ